MIDREARARLTTNLAARKLVDFSGPHGWDTSATTLGRVTTLATTPVEGVVARLRRVLPLVELRTSFTLECGELADVDRGADDVDLGALDLESGQDLSVGYAGRTLDTIHLYVEESVSFRVTEPDAAVVLRAL